MDFTSIYTVLLIFAVAALIVVASIIIFPALKKKGVNPAATLDFTESILESADTVTDILRAAFPKSLLVSIADKIIDYAEIGVQKAEQLYHINEIGGGERKSEATQFVYDALKIAGVERTPEIDKIIDGAIEAAVLTLGHSGKPPDATPPESPPLI